MPSRTRPLDRRALRPATGPGRDPEQAERVRIALERLDRALAAWR